MTLENRDDEELSLTFVPVVEDTGVMTSGKVRQKSVDGMGDFTRTLQKALGANALKVAGVGKVG